MPVGFETLLHQIASGLANGAIYAVLALALVIVYRATHHINFVQGELAVFSTFVVWSLLEAGLPYWAALATSLVVSFLLAALIEAVILRQFADSPSFTVISVLIGLLIVQNSLNGALFGYMTRQLPSPFPDPFITSSRFFSSHQLGSLLVIVGVIVVVYVFLRFTKLGLAMRAVADNRTSSSLSGIPVALILAASWGLAACVGAIAGVLTAPIVYLDPNMMMGVLVYAFAGALLGGIDNPWGAAVGGLLVGVGENLAGAYVVGNELKLAFAMTVIVVVLLLRPAGLFGRATVERV
jgi:branched-chain amino acid transport system permease protein